jgi:hypothetical protein
VEVSFVGATVFDAKDLKEKSWTSSIRVVAPSGEQDPSEQACNSFGPALFLGVVQKLCGNSSWRCLVADRGNGIACILFEVGFPGVLWLPSSGPVLATSC